MMAGERSEDAIIAFDMTSVRLSDYEQVGDLVPSPYTQYVAKCVCGKRYRFDRETVESPFPPCPGCGREGSPENGRFHSGDFYNAGWGSV